MSSSALNVSDLASILHSNSIRDYCGIAARLILLYDQIITLPLEKEVIWERRISSVTLLYYLNRWSAFVWALYDVAHLRVEPNSLTYGNFFATWFHVDRLHTGAPVCATGMVYRIANATSVAIIVANVLVMLITWSKTYALKKEADNNGVNVSLADMLRKDGSVFFFIGVGVNSLGLIVRDTNVFLFAPSTFLPVLSSLMISHFLLNLRPVPQDDIPNTSLPQFMLPQHPRLISKFGSFADNMGEPLRDDTDSSDPDMTWEDNDSAMPADNAVNPLAESAGNLKGADVEKATEGEIVEVSRE
ncbi:hypothetical protein OBBRIDRAFT_836366 [Obba rivulosa]|uniref:DUF6533 domain-containing protein n=1 Tax=Obba rivulosa TaxID=1052685 RepID=A0A8E2ASX9_9APHY|nr:hypothetical protein OBBRIDRAFT_836366 [Obba rivulosa]